MLGDLRSTSAIIETKNVDRQTDWSNQTIKDVSKIFSLPN